MVINYSINSDQTQEEEVCPVATMMVMVPGISKTGRLVPVIGDI